MVKQADKHRIEKLLPELANVIRSLEAKLLTSSATTNDLRVAIRLLKMDRIVMTELVKQ